MTMLVLLFAAVAFLAWSNGANDNFKGVAALYGSGIASYWKALAWATVTTGAGSVAALFLAAELLHKFSGKGLVPEALTASPAFLLAVALGAGSTVLLATRLGFPVSTTHAITGALVGAGLTAAPDAVNFARLWEGFAKPLLLSPLVAVGTGALLFVILRALRLAFHVGEAPPVLRRYVDIRLDFYAADADGHRIFVKFEGEGAEGAGFDGDGCAEDFVGDQFDAFPDLAGIEGETIGALPAGDFGVQSRLLPWRERIGIDD